LRVRSGCRGNGLCGLCLVQIEAGEVSPPTANERLMLGALPLEQNVRLACQVMPQHDLSIKIINAAAKSNWRSLPPANVAQTPTRIQAVSRPGYGVAVDLGTTHISLTLLDLRQGVRITGRIGLNPQCLYGSDVMTRLVAIGESADAAVEMSRMAFDEIHAAILDICSRHGVNSREIVHLAVVGNTAMLAILTQTAPEALLRPESWTREMECPLRNPKSWVDTLGLHPQAVVDVVPPLAGFVGSDLLAGVLATRLVERPGGLLIDFGTNSEIAFWDGNKLWATSAAGGPAFEGSGIPCGMPAESGAIRRFTPKQTSTEFDCLVVDDAEPKGICGSGLVDLIACLLRTGRLTRMGKFATPNGDGFIVRASHPVIRLNVKDVDLFQRAKAAIGVGIRTLLTMANRNADQIERVCVCGAFGQYLDIENAQAIGLLPRTPPERVELCGNTALGGCELLLQAPEAWAELASLRKSAAIVNLAQVPDFDAAFMDCLYLKPLEVIQP
jgi:uncharacterized 2Fe-2S/4Fe-4S cluster protein (DUF4445 family)